LRPWRSDRGRARGRPSRPRQGDRTSGPDGARDADAAGRCGLEDAPSLHARYRRLRRTMAGDRIALGIIRKAHGVRGEASVEAWSDSPDRFAGLSAVTLVSPDESQTRDAAIESVRIHAGRALVKFAGIDAPEDVRPLQNWTVEVPLTDARPLEADEYFLHDL